MQALPVSHRTPPLDGWFPVRITAVISDTEYEFEEVAVDGEGAVVTKPAGRLATTFNPAVPITGTYSVDDYTLARSAPTAGGNLWELLAVESGLPSCHSACGSLVGITTAACLKLSLVCHTGEFTDISESQFTGVYAFGSGGTWTFKKWVDGAPGSWTNFTFDWEGGTGTVVFTFDGDGNSVLTVGGNVMKRRCDERDATFEGGRQNGFTGNAEDLPADFCASNTFVLKVECSCCPIDGWEGDGWYCVAINPDTCEGDLYCVELLEAEGDHCDPDIVICSGPYATPDDCLAACASVGPPDPTCQGHVFTNATATITNDAGACACLPDTIAASVQGTDSATFGVSNPPCNTNGGIFLACSGGNYALAVSGSNSVTLTGTSTSPFMLVYDVVMNSSPTNICPSGSFTITITDPP